MSSASKILVVVFALILAGVGYLLLQDGGGVEPPIVGPDTPSDAQQPESPPAEVIRAKEPAETPAKDQRTRIGDQTQDDPSRYAQGVRGRLRDPFGGPVAGTTVYLMEGAGMDLFKIMQAQARGVQLPPIASVKTDPNGRFQIGLAHPDKSKEYEVRIAHERFVDHVTPRIQIEPEQWYGLDVQLQKGTVLTGRVVIEGTGMGVPDAIVAVQTAGFFPSISPTPGRENGIQVRTDPTGQFRFENVAAGIANISAVAPGFARVEKQNMSIEADKDNVVAFELPKGLSIQGIVVDATGQPVAGARIEANSISSKAPSNGTARSDRDGRFDMIGLLEGPYIVAAAAPGFVRKEQKPIQAGDHKVEIVLEQQGRARLRVLDRNGRLMSSFYVTVKRYFEGQEQYGNTDIPARQARHGPEGYYEVSGLDPQSYVFQVEAANHCKAFSEPFQVVIGEEPSLVELRMTQGGSIAGVVRDSAGRPLPGVLVQTFADHYEDNAITKLFGGMIPFKITRAETRTDAEGRYRLELLNPGSYQLRLSHPGHYDQSVKGNQVVDGQEFTIAPIAMRKGTAVTGTVRVDGMPAAQVKVTINSIPEPIPTDAAGQPLPIDPDRTPAATFSSEAISDNDGKFTFDKQIPPGRYQVMAARQTLANPLMQIADFAKTKREITLAPGQTQFFLQFTIAGNQ